MHRSDQPDQLEGGVVVEVAEATDAVTAGTHLDGVGPAGGERHGGDEVLTDLDHTVAGQVLGDERAAQARPDPGAVPLDGCLLGGDHRWEVVEGVHLAVLVRQRRADLGAVVLEGHHVRPPVTPQPGGVLAQHRHHRRQLRRRQLRRAHHVTVGVGHDERPAGRPSPTIVDAVGGRRVDGDRRVAVVEHGHLVRARQLGAPRAQRADRILLAADRGAGAHVAGRRHQHPRVRRAVQAALQHRRVERRGDRAGQVPHGLAAVDVERTAIGMTEIAAGQHVWTQEVLDR